MAKPLGKKRVEWIPSVTQVQGIQWERSFRRSGFEVEFVRLETEGVKPV